ncbi:MAG: serine/threonine-protein phosphatase [Oscillospiraceae bacterium]|nr:serine/threonine-protein phosphatase [Oscillospiraceae bacterium]MCI9668771.1 serine/threonine-protein phosphatase [Oscillospiraceae bacterium]
MIRIYGGTDEGRVRSVNQDAYVCEVLDSETAYAVLCDGMGGAGGHIASSRTAQIIGHALSRGLASGTPAASFQALFTSAASAANAVIYDMARQDPALAGMGTTVVILAVKGGIAYIGHAGDSRIYEIIGEPPYPRKLTKDHSMVQQLVDVGRITEEEAKDHPKRNLITRAVGVEREVRLEYMEQPFVTGRLLLCTDGLYNFAPPEDHMDLILSCASDEDLYLLIDEANKAGGADNITALIVVK